MRWGAAQREQALKGQMGLFGAEETRPPAPAKVKKLSKLELLRFEKEALGLYISDHPMNSYPGLSAAASCPVDGLEAWFKAARAAAGESQGQYGSLRLKVALAGMLQNIVKKPTKKGTMMARFELADESGSREVVAFSRTYDEVADRLVEDAPAVLIAELSEDGDAVRVVADRLIRWEEREGLPKVAIAEFDLDEVDAHLLYDFRSQVDEYAGLLPLRFRVRSARGVATYATQNIRIDEEKLKELETSCPWLKTTVTVDRDSLLRERDNGNRYRKAVPAPAQAEVPF